ncbi:tartrate transporter [Coprinopsis cinerea okayama7|uniref:Tartrate transporter n=1 Tax=Coprinopsis cinerea (strain Okayama-7 / 130 / ATCC MYA-4618 / FGSC 9003) TaxID=240176 RepID=D6RMR2_COPC7|nr:tartrate transporter [Coprinopsis cinerea okayama7\|eukprot:XP_002911189.1 tartrate transporter [Coprinopsis cinerea okayama7\
MRGEGHPIQPSYRDPLEQPLLAGSNAGHDDPEVFGLDDAGKREQLERRLVRKLDARMSILIVIYILNYIDRNNAAAARLHGFQGDLELDDKQFANVLSILYVGYFIMQVPSNIYLNHSGRPSIYLPSCMVIWGGISMATGLVTNYFGVLCARFLLGFVEAAFYPGALFMISRWYKRSELSQRMALLSCGSLISNAFGALIASGILELMDGVMGLNAWRWLFFVEGGLTVLVAIGSIFILPDFPETTTGWLTPEEKDLAIQRMVEDSGGHDVRKQSTELLSGLRLALGDPKVWWLTFGLCNLVVALSFHAYFPTLADTLGFSPTISLLLCAPPWLVATVIVLYITRISDQRGERCRYIIFSISIGMAGFAISMLTMNLFWRYLSLFFMTSSYAAFACMLAWASSSASHPPAKRAVALAFMNCISQLGNVVGS